MLILICAVVAKAQTTIEDIEMADTMRSNGKIYVVIGTIVIIFVGLAIYLFTIDRRLKRLEKEK